MADNGESTADASAPRDGREPTVGVVCGMQSEFRALGRWVIDPCLRVAVSGARPDLAEDAARWCAAEGCQVLISFGVAGGLDPALAPGTLVAANKVRDEAGRVFPLGEVPGQAPDGAAAGSLLGVDAPVLEAATKARLFAETGCAAIDMETHRVAAVASELGLTALALRAVGDPSDQSLPSFVADALSETGHPRLWPILTGLLRHPGALPDLLRLKRATDAALGRLRALAEDGQTLDRAKAPEA